MSTTESINGNKSPQHHPPEGTWDTIEASSRTVFPDTGFVYHSAEWPYTEELVQCSKHPYQARSRQTKDHMSPHHSPIQN